MYSELDGGSTLNGTLILERDMHTNQMTADGERSENISQKGSIMTDSHNPYEGLDMPTPPQGYRLLGWQEEADGGCLWYVSIAKEWGRWGQVRAEDFQVSRPADWSIFAVPERIDHAATVR